MPTPQTVQITGEAKLADVKGRLEKTSSELKGALKGLKTARGKNLAMRKAYGMPDVDPSAQPKCAPNETPLVFDDGKYVCTVDCNSKNAVLFNRPGYSQSFCVSADSPTQGQLQSTVQGLTWLSGPVYPSMPSKTSRVRWIEAARPMSLGRLGAFALKKYTAADLQRDSDTYAAGQLMVSNIDQALAGKRKVYYAVDGDLLLEQLPSDKYAAGIDAQGLPQTFALPSTAEAQANPNQEGSYPTQPAAAGTLSGWGGYVTAGLLTLAAIVAIPATGGIALPCILALGAAAVATATAVQAQSEIVADTNNKMADAYQDCMKLAKTPADSAACADANKKVQEAQGDYAKKEGEGSGLGQVSKSFADIASSFSTIAIVGLLAYAGFSVISMLRSNKAASPEPQPATP